MDNQKMLGFALEVLLSDGVPRELRTEALQIVDILRGDGVVFEDCSHTFKVGICTVELDLVEMDKVLENMKESRIFAIKELRKDYGFGLREAVKLLDDIVHFRNDLKEVDEVF